MLYYHNNKFLQLCMFAIVVNVEFLHGSGDFERLHVEATIEAARELLKFTYYILKTQAHRSIGSQVRVWIRTHMCCSHAFSSRAESNC